ncbi:MAG: hypothetical protein JOZ91_09510 [Candidatus Eremiobacteraeota bacterium]|nr:hypothetical protein [Candidatus Eremiobacteraeota bacterium]MBV8264251.1 hypothetical protein [Candidatus Eremiobacteraeota bacterium]
MVIRLPVQWFCVAGGKLDRMDETTFTVGQLAGPGTYRCLHCGKQTVEYALSFEIEPCSCGGVTFRRID